MSVSGPKGGFGARIPVTETPGDAGKAGAATTSTSGAAASGEGAAAAKAGAGLAGPGGAAASFEKVTTSRMGELLGTGGTGAPAALDAHLRQIDGPLARFAAAAGPETPRGVASAAAAVVRDPAAFVAGDGSVKPVELGTLLSRELGAREPEARSLAFDVLGSLAGGDIEALAMLVMMEAAKSAREDLKAIMGELAGKRAAEPGSTSGLEASNAHAADAVGLRDVLSAAAAGKAAAGEATAESSRASRDSLTDLSSIDSMELQRLMERRAKVFETLSNVLKKISETSSQITGNLK